MDNIKRMDERQAALHEHFPSTHYLHKPENVMRLMEWITFYRRNPSRFVEHYFGIVLHLYQHIILYLMEFVPSFCIVAARSAAKSFLIAIFACKEAILRPGAKIVVASATKKQARLIVSEKIKKELIPKSPLLAAEIDSFKDNQNEIEVIFKNGSSIVVVAANENARGYRATVMIYEEFRMIVKNIIDSVLSPFLYIRQADYLKLPEYSSMVEEPKEVYISSAWYQSHWMWKLIQTLTKDMFTDGSSCVIAMDYSIALKHNIKTRNFLIKERKKLDPISWAIEYENQMIAENAKSFFNYEQLNRNRRLKRAFYPRRNDEALLKQKNKYDIPKQVGEIRILSCDIAMEGGNATDNSIYSCIRLLPESQEYKVMDTQGEHIEVKRGYRRQVSYMEAVHGGETTKQAIRIKQLYTDFNADYCVLDGRNAGISVYDMLAKVLYDEERNMEYKPWKCMNDEKVANRIQIAGAEENVYIIKAQLETNSNIAESMRNALNSGMIDLLISNTEAVDEIANFIPEYATADVDTQLFFERPYLETVALINEMIDLEYERGEQTGLIKIVNNNNRKDRYTSVSYGNYFAQMLEHDMLSDSSEYEYLAEQLSALLGRKVVKVNGVWYLDSANGPRLFHTGLDEGYVGGRATGADEVLSVLKDGELVMTKDQYMRIFNSLKYGITGVLDSLIGNLTSTSPAVSEVVKSITNDNSNTDNSSTDDRVTIQNYFQMQNVTEENMKGFAEYYSEYTIGKLMSAAKRKGLKNSFGNSMLR